jgi:hypothetical protein
MMATVREPVLRPVPIAELRPTHITVGMREVVEKRKRWRMEGKKKAAEFLGKHMVPVILGPKERHYVIDHHHLARALHDGGVENVLVTVVENLSGLEREAFWFVLDNRSWMHPYDEDGRRRGYKDIPASAKDLVDDPFRSLAGELRRGGDLLKILPLSANSFGRTFFAGESSGGRSKKISPRQWKRRCNSPRASKPMICLAGAGRRRRADPS